LGVFLGIFYGRPQVLESHAAIYLLVLILCGCNGGSRGVLRVGVDANWYPLNFGPQTSYVNGFTEDMLIEMARYSGIEFERISANWDTLYDGLKEKRYDAILTSLPPYEFNKAKYEFSSNYLDVGPILIVPTSSSQADLSKMGGSLIGILSGDPAALLIEAHPSLIIRNFSTIPDLLDALVRGDIQGALLDRIPAVNFVKDLYSDQLKIASPPLTDKGLHLVAPKGRNNLIHAFNKNLEGIKRNKTLSKLRQKWQLE
jgi:polar amino acid transport system substrate-binding protein